VAEVSIAAAFDAPLTLEEKRDAFEEMDLNKDGVISSDEFVASPEVAKLPAPVQKELFDAIDTNKDHVIQYEEFSTAADKPVAVPILAPKRAPLSQPVRAPVQVPVQAAPQPVQAAPQPVQAAPQPVQAAPQPMVRPAGGKMRTGAIPGVHHVLQTGVHCGGCNIGVEHHWRMCPVCGSGL